MYMQILTEQTPLSRILIAFGNNILSIFCCFSSTVDYWRHPRSSDPFYSIIELNQAHEIKISYGKLLRNGSRVISSEPRRVGLKSVEIDGREKSGYAQCGVATILLPSRPGGASHCNEGYHSGSDEEGNKHEKRK